jgi:hypothetical protein
LFESAAYGCLFTYLTEEAGAVFIEDMKGSIKRKFNIKEIGEFTNIDDYAINNEYIFVTHRKLNRIDAYGLSDFKFVGSITNFITGDKLFRPLKLMVSQLIYIHNVNSIILVSYNSKPTLVSIIDLKVNSLADEWRFIHDTSTLVIIYAHLNTIEEYSLNSIE